jgi:hypothetical protein
MKLLNKLHESSIGSSDLISIGDLCLNNHGLDPEISIKLSEVAEWLQNFVAKPNPGLGRKGDVCPFVRRSINKFDGIYFSIWNKPELSARNISECLRDFVKRFPNLTPNKEDSRDFKSVVIVFPDSDLAKIISVIDGVHQELKSEVVSKGMMIGQFYGDSLYPGLHSTTFRPFNSPCPLIVLRYMQVIDLPFLCRSPSDINSYCSNFKVGSPEELQKKVERLGIDSLPIGWNECVDSLFGVTRCE